MARIAEGQYRCGFSMLADAVATSAVISHRIKPKKMKSKIFQVQRAHPIDWPLKILVGRKGFLNQFMGNGLDLTGFFLEAGEEEAGEDFFGVFLEEDAVVVDGGVADEGVDGGEVGADDFAVAGGDE